MIVEIAVAAVASYLCGSIPFAVLVPKWLGLPDPRSYGSGNPGATNVMRSGSKLAGRSVFALDLFKGIGPVAVCGLLLESENLAAVAALFSVFGHIWSPWLKFKGGRGVATGFGALLMLDWRLLAGGLALWAVLYFSTKIVSLASVAAFVCAMLLAAWLYEFGSFTSMAVAGMAMAITIRHRENFKRMMEGKENKF